MPGQYVSRRLALHEQATFEDVRRLEEDAGWEILGQILQDLDRGVNFEVKWDASDGVSVHYVEDETAKEIYIVVAGDSPDAVAPVFALLERNLDVWTLDELVASIDESDVDSGKVKAVMRAGLGAPTEFCEPIFDRVRAAAAHPEPAMRWAAIWAMIYSGWSAYRPMLRELADSDPDDDMRRNARLALETFDRNGIGSR